MASVVGWKPARDAARSTGSATVATETAPAKAVVTALCRRAVASPLFFARFPLRKRNSDCTVSQGA
jgi:hypothetical protein